MVTDFQEWVRRRVEHVSFIDDVSVARHVSIDFAIPQSLGSFNEVDEALLPWIPLTFLNKKLLRHFDLRDSAGHPIPMLTKAENGRVAGDTLVVLAETILGARLPGEIEGRVRGIVDAPPDIALAELERWSSSVVDQADPHRQVWERLLAREGFTSYAHKLAEDFLLLATCPALPGRRQVVKLSYEEPFGNEDEDSSTDVRWYERVAISLGWRVKTVRLSMPAVNLAASFHAEIPAPYDMEIDAARLRFAVAPHRSAEAPEPTGATDGPLIQRAHLYTAHVSSEFIANAIVLLRARRPGFLRAAVATGWLTAILLGAGYAFLPAITKSANSTTAGALLLIVPSLLAGALIRPGEHRLVARVLLGVRCLLAACMVSTLLAVGLLSGAARSVIHPIWLCLLVIAVAAAVGLTMSFLLPRPTKD